jgi:hypothetical protein
MDKNLFNEILNTKQTSKAWNSITLTYWTNYTAPRYISKFFSTRQMHIHTSTTGIKYNQTLSM